LSKLTPKNQLLGHEVKRDRLLSEKNGKTESDNLRRARCTVTGSASHIVKKLAKEKGHGKYRTIDEILADKDEA
jgi:hypothetical protein